MIVMGYPCIGKTTLSQKSLEYIDLETTNFWLTKVTSQGKETYRPADWHKIYCNIAIDLHKQGYIVLTSPNIDIRMYFIHCKEKGILTFEDIVCTCFPSLKMKDFWIQRAQHRYDRDPSNKNKRALDHILDFYEDDITGMAHSPFIHIKLFNNNYDLDRVIQNQKRRSEAIIEQKLKRIEGR